jgi:hypothetical protein
VTLLSQLSTLLHGCHSKPINSQDAFLYSFFVGPNWSGELYLSPFPNRLSNLPFNCHTPISLYKLILPSNYFLKTTQSLIQSYHRRRKKKKNFCKTQNGGISSSLDVVGS